MLLMSPFYLHGQDSIYMEVKTGPSIGKTVKYQPYSSRFKTNYDVSLLVGLNRNRMTYGTGLYFFSLGSNFHQDIRVPGKVKRVVKTSFDIHYISIPLFSKYSIGEWTISLGLSPSLTIFSKGADSEDHKVVGGDVIIESKRIQKESVHFGSKNVINPFLITSYLELGRYIEIIHKRFFLGLKYTHNLTRAISINPAFHPDYEKFYSISIQIGHTIFK